MTKELRETYSFRPDDLIKLLHDTWVYAYIVGVCELSGVDEELVPMDKGGPQTEAWVMNRVEDLKKLKRRKDGTFYQARKTPNV